MTSHDEIRADQPATRIGFIGLGVMGLPMASNLQAGGHRLVVHSRTKSRAVTLVAGGATWADSPAEVARQTEIVITMLPDGPDVREVAESADGLFAGAHPGMVWIDMSSISPVTTRQLGSHARLLGIRPLDAPVSGGEVAAQEAALSIMVGGEPDLLHDVLPILDLLGTRIMHMGSTGAGQVAKACNQVIVGGTIAIVAEALTLGVRAGVDADLLRQALLGGFAQSRVLEVHGERMLRSRFEPGFRLSLHQKDLRIALETAESVNAWTPMTAQVTSILGTLDAADLELDHSALAKAYARDSGTDRDS